MSLGPKSLILASEFIQWTLLRTYYVPDTAQEDEFTEMNLGSFQAEAERSERHYIINDIIYGKCHS